MEKGVVAMKQAIEPANDRSLLIRIMTSIIITIIAKILPLLLKAVN
jgi:hypothetical protein